MGNQNSSISSHTRPLQEEAGTGELRRKLVVGNDSPLPVSYGATNVVNKVSPIGASKNKNSNTDQPSLIKPVQVQQEGKHGQNQLVIPLNNTDGHLYKPGPSASVPLSTIICRVSCAVFVAVILLIFLSLLIAVAVDPSNYSRNPWLLKNTDSSSIPVLIEEINPFWYETITLTNHKPSPSYQYAGALSCDELIYDNTTQVSNLFYSRTIDKDSYQQLTKIAPFSYLLQGSLILITINITSPPVDGKNVSLLRFGSPTEYSKLSDPSTASSAQYDEEILLNSTLGSRNEIVIDCNSNGFQLFGLKTPSGFKFTYNFIIYLVYLNDSLIDDNQCLLSSVETSCEIKLNNTKLLHSKMCLIGSCALIDGSAEYFCQLELSVSRRYMNWIMCSLIALVVSFLMIFVAIGTYDCMRKKIYPIGKKAVSIPFHRRERI